MSKYPFVIFILNDELERIKDDLKNNNFGDDEKEIASWEDRKEQLEETIELLSIKEEK